MQQGTPAQVYHQPVNAYAAALFGKYNLLSPAQAQVFSGLLSTRLNGKNMLIRPENFSIVPEGNEAILAAVNKVNFFGSYYEVEAALPETVITIKTNLGNIATGDKIYISLSPNSVWYI